nr:hypothetical protein [Spirochaeta isovalerica]
MDLTLARADAAIKFRCIKPEISHNGFILASNLRFLPVEENCLNERVPYTPLSAEFDAPHIVISGSNMGGKTVVLKTLLFAQILSQMGFFVPATRFKTILFRSFNLIGDKLGTGVNGLSSFGEEIMSLIEGAAEGRTLYIIDEFARTTNSAEALALNSALLKSFSGRKETWSFSSTHQENLPELENISYWTMRGLDYLKYGEYFHSNFKGDLSERIRLINKYMDYRIEPRAAGAVNSRDALKIADILGLDSQLIGYAEKYMEKQEKQNG